MTGDKLSNDARTRIRTMVETNDGFLIAEVDMQIRGPGEIEGTRQSGAPVYLLADLRLDDKILQAARNAAIQLLEVDPELQLPENKPLFKFIESKLRAAKTWGKVS